MADTFHLHNRLRTDVSADLCNLEVSALERKDLLQRLLLQLKKSNKHLQSMTDEEILED
jgi:hypothetical protein